MIVFYLIEWSHITSPFRMGEIASRIGYATMRKWETQGKLWKMQVRAALAWEL